MTQVYGWWDGACEPWNPAAISTYGCVARVQEVTVFEERGLAAQPFTEQSTNDVAEYMGLIKLLQWLAHNGYTTSKVQLHGDSKLVISQVLDKAQVRTEHLRPLHRLAREYLSIFKDVEITWVPREQNLDADRLTHRAYVEYLETNPQAQDRLPLASEDQLRTLQAHGIETYPFMGVREANRLLEKRLRALEPRRPSE